MRGVLTFKLHSLINSSPNSINVRQGIAIMLRQMPSEMGIYYFVITLAGGTF
jgi:hypothetical protein